MCGAIYLFIKKRPVCVCVCCSEKVGRNYNLSRVDWWKEITATAPAAIKKSRPCFDERKKFEKE